MAGRAFIFPGQGSQYVGMGQDIFNEYHEAADIFRMADSVLGFPISRLCFEGPGEELKKTANTQPAILTVSIAIHEILKRKKETPVCAAGHSLGEFSAHVAAGTLNFEDAVVLVRKRGEYMQNACPQGEGDMAAIIGLSEEKVRQICEECSCGEVLSPANFNSPEQTVIAGTAAAVGRAIAAARDAGAKKAVQLPVSAPFHCALMKLAADKLKNDIMDISFNDPSFPVIVNCSAEPVTNAGDARDALIRQVVSPVRWVESVMTMKSLGVSEMTEIGPGKVLKGLIKRIDRDINVVSVENNESLCQYLQSEGDV